MLDCVIESDRGNLTVMQRLDSIFFHNPFLKNKRIGSNKRAIARPQPLDRTFQHVVACLWNAESALDPRGARGLGIVRRFIPLNAEESLQVPFQNAIPSCHFLVSILGAIP